MRLIKKHNASCANERRCRNLNLIPAQQNSGVTLENSRGQSLKSSLFLIKCGTLSENWFYFFMRTCELKRERYLIFAIRCLFFRRFLFFVYHNQVVWKLAAFKALKSCNNLIKYLRYTSSTMIHIKDKILLFVCMYKHPVYYLIVKRRFNYQTNPIQE